MTFDYIPNNSLSEKVLSSEGRVNFRDEELPTIYELIDLIASGKMLSSDERVGEVGATREVSVLYRSGNEE